ncbi:hypothetical protein HYS93_01160 [Candidatus Daviesbacteria bacterium]|nr:hypothetical protein [Candidatus Daviesbacteria bacterium]
MIKRLTIISILTLNFLPIKTVYAVDLSEQFPFGKYLTLGQGTQPLIGPIFNLAAIMVIFYFLIAAVRYILAGGDKENLAKARAMMYHAFIGFLLLILIFLVLQFIPQALGLNFRVIE